jgi:RNA polymerase sigma-70 factor (ECF subfamily)
VIKVAPAGDALAMSDDEASVTSAEGRPARVRDLVTTHFSFVWRSLVRLGVPRADAEDALQHVFLVASRKVDAIEPGSEKAFLFATALRIASRSRRTQTRRREVFAPEPLERADPAAAVDEQLDRARARAELDVILDSMPLELRAVFMLFELEQITMAEIAVVLELPPGTVASRLRRAREHFEAAVKRLAARGRHHD